MKKKIFLISTIAIQTLLPIASCAKNTAESRVIILDDTLTEMKIIENDPQCIECMITAKSVVRTVKSVNVTIGSQELLKEEFNFDISTSILSIGKDILDKYAGQVTIRPVVITYFQRMQLDYTKMLLDNVDCTNVPTYLTHLTQTSTEFGYFDDIDYTSQDKANWPALQHLNRSIAIAVDAVNSGEIDQLVKCIDLAKHWLKHDYQNPNSWFVQIGTPRDLSDLALFVFNYLDYDNQEKMIEIIRRGSLLYNPEVKESQPTGTNLFWYADISMKDSWLTDDVEEFEVMFQKVNDEIKEGGQDGFQSDGSYYQHDHQLYNGGYGRQGVILLAKIMSAFANTPLRWDENKLEIIVNFILRGLSTTIHKGYTDYGTMGRTYCRKEANQIDGGTTDLGNILLLRYVAQLPNCPHKEEVKKVLQAWQEGGTCFNGINYLSNSNFVSMCIDGIYMSFKGTNDKMRNSEKINGENMLGYNLSYGTSTCVMETGKEYFDITPVWDYASIPGTTALTETDEDLDWYDNATHIKRILEEGIYGGGTVDGITFSMQSTYHENTHYTVTCFATEDGMVLLGSDLENRLGDLHTTVEQCIVNEDVTPTISEDNKSVTHGNIVYTCINPDDTFSMTNEAVTKSWNRNNRSYDVSDTATKQVLTIKIVPPASATDITNYAYCIQPKTKIAKKFEVAQNTAKTHAIKLPSGKIAAAFYADDEFTYGGKTYSGKQGEYKVFEA